MSKGKGAKAAQLLQEGFRLHQEGRLDEAEQKYRLVLAMAPNVPDALNLLGVIRRSKGDREGAIRLLEKAVTLAPKLIAAWRNYGNALFDFGAFARAAEAFEQELSLDPNRDDAWCALGRARKLMEDLPGAVTAFDRAIALAPNNDLYPFERSLARLMLGDYAAGWEDYETRWLQPHLRPHRKTLPQPEWQGEPIPGKRLFVMAEQGFGDAFQFVRFAPLLAEQGVRVIIAAPNELNGVLATLPGIEQFYVSGDILPPFDLYCNMLSLPRLMRCRPETIPANIPYLFAAPNLVEEWKQRLGPRNESLRVGLIWAGRPTFSEDHRRSPRFETFLQLLKVPGVAFYGLQVGDGRRDLENRTLPPNFTDIGAEIRGFEDTAAIMSHMDVIISSCTGPAHLAGALGRPLWVVLSDAADWRWFRKREDSPWYPSARLFRQKQLGDWSPVIQKVADSLSNLTLDNKIQPKS
ncbi:hypothetical protein CCP2SC5_190022 [Azospirillaceae bacterium]